MNTKSMLNCKKCNSNDFYIISDLLYAGNINQENRNLEINKHHDLIGGTDVILCQFCSEEYLHSDFNGVVFI